MSQLQKAAFTLLYYFHMEIQRCRAEWQYPTLHEARFTTCSRAMHGRNPAGLIPDKILGFGQYDMTLVPHMEEKA